MTVEFILSPSVSTAEFESELNAKIEERLQNDINILNKQIDSLCNESESKEDEIKRKQNEITNVDNDINNLNKNTIITCYNLLKEIIMIIPVLLFLCPLYNTSTCGETSTKCAHQNLVALMELAAA